MTLFRNRSRAFLLSLVLGAVGAAGCEPETPVLDIPKDLKNKGAEGGGPAKGQPKVKSIKDTRPSGEGAETKS